MHSNAKNTFLVGFVCLLAFLATIPLSAQEGKKYGKLYLREYQAKTADEAAIVNVLMQYDAAFNSHDLQKLLSFFAKDAIYMPCGNSYEKYPAASKECQNIIKRNFGLFGFETYYDPTIAVNGNKAIVKLLIETGDYLADYTFFLTRVGQDWQVQEADYTNDRGKE